MNVKNSQSLAAGLLMLLLGLAVIFLLIPHGVVEPRKVKFAALSPSYYPRIVAICLAVLGLAVTIRSLSWRSDFRTEATGLSDKAGKHPNAFVRIAMFFAIMLFFAIAIKPLGFLITSAIAMLASMILAGERRPALIATLSIALPLLLYFFFLKVAGIPIPTGVLAPWLQGL
jgi:hypothetical protein